MGPNPIRFLKNHLVQLLQPIFGGDGKVDFLLEYDLLLHTTKSFFLSFKNLLFPRRYNLLSIAYSQIHLLISPLPYGIGIAKIWYHRMYAVMAETHLQQTAPCAKPKVIHCLMWEKRIAMKLPYCSFYAAAYEQQTE